MIHFVCIGVAHPRLVTPQASIFVVSLIPFLAPDTNGVVWEWALKPRGWDYHSLTSSGVPLLIILFIYFAKRVTFKINRHHHHKASRLESICIPWASEMDKTWSKPMAIPRAFISINFQNLHIHAIWSQKFMVVREKFRYWRTTAWATTPIAMDIENPEKVLEYWVWNGFILYASYCGLGKVKAVSKVRWIIFSCFRLPKSLNNVS